MGEQGQEAAGEGAWAKQNALCSQALPPKPGRQAQVPVELTQVPRPLHTRLLPCTDRAGSAEALATCARPEGHVSLSQDHPA